MTPEAFDDACRALPAVTTVVQWGDAQVYKVGGRVFAITPPDGGCSLKATEIALGLDRERAGPSGALSRARQMAAVRRSGGGGRRGDGRLAGHRHALVAAKLTRKQRVEFGLTATA